MCSCFGTLMFCSLAPYGQCKYVLEDMMTVLKGFESSNGLVEIDFGVILRFCCDLVWMIADVILYLMDFKDGIS